jgi:hypothetical protein
MDRKDVYALIDGERDYQNTKWNDDYDDSQWAVGDWLTFIERYIFEARDVTGHPELMMDSIRKIGALAVAAMEYNDTNPR